MKICSICKLPDKKFYTNSSRKDGLQTYCIDCAKTRSKIMYKNFSTEKKKKIKDLAHAKSIRNKQFVWDFLKENPCVDCGEHDPVILEFDHFRDKKGNVSELCKQALSLDRIKAELNKCEVRCCNCHRRKTAIQFGWYKNIVL